MSVLLVACLALLPVLASAAPEARFADLSGLAMDADGAWIAIGEPFHDGRRGRVALLRHDGRDWVEVDALTAPGAQPGDEFGFQVAIDGEWLAALHNADETVLLFRRVGDTWTLFDEIEPPTRIPSALAPAGAPAGSDSFDVYDIGLGHSFGTHIELDGNLLAIGAPRYSRLFERDGHYNGGNSDGPFVNHGAIFVYAFEADTWTLDAYLDTWNPGDYFGSPVVNGDRVIGSCRVIAIPCVLPWRRTESGWVPEDEIVPPTGDQWGAQATDGPWLVLRTTEPCPNPGGRCPRAEIFRREGEAWTWKQTLVNPDRPPASERDGFGDFSIVGDRLVATDREAPPPDGGSRKGAVYTFEWDGGAFELRAELRPRIARDDERFAWGLAQSAGPTVAVRALGPDATYVFGAPDTPLSKTDTQCVVGLGKSFEKLSSARGKALQKCLKTRASKGGSVSGCMAAAAAKLAKAEQKTRDTAAKRCPVDPLYGSDGPEMANRAARNADGLLGDLFGGLDESIAPDSAKTPATRCQLAIARDVGRCQASWLKHFNRCAQRGLSKGTLASSIELESCLLPDEKGKLARACGADAAGWANKTIPKTCADVDLAAAFPSCGADTPEELSQCLADAAACRVCRAVNEAAGVSAACTTCPEAVAFVTSTLHAPEDIGGLEGADAICRARAAEGGLRGSFRAWISTAEADLRDRIEGDGWVRPDGKVIATSRVQIVDGQLLHPIRIDEQGNDVTDALGSSRVWTGSSLYGRFQPNSDCGAWTDASGFGSQGSATAGGTPWVRSEIGIPCSEARRLYCGTGGTAPDPPSPVESPRDVFLTSERWTPGGGRADANAFCDADAAKQGLAPPYKAVLADVGLTLGQVLGSCSDLPLVRLDGIPILARGCELFGLGPDGTLLAPIHLRSDGWYRGAEAVWTGAADPGSPGTADSTCNGWTSSSNADTAIVGRSGESGPGWLNYEPRSCDRPARLYCRR